MSDAAIIRNRGVFTSEAIALTSVVDRLVDAFDPDCVWLFGSRATGAGRPDGDFDLLIVAKPDGMFGSEDYEKVVGPLLGLGVGCDVVPCSMEDFKEASEIKTSLVAQVVTHGRKLYDAATR